MKHTLLLMVSLLAMSLQAQTHIVEDEYCEVEKYNETIRISKDFDLRPAVSGVRDDIRTNLILWRDYNLFLVDQGKCRVTPQHGIAVDCDPNDEVVRLCTQTVPADTTWVYPKADQKMYQYYKWLAKKHYSIP